MNELQLSYETYLSDFCEAIFAREFVSRGLSHCRTARWRTGIDRFAEDSLGTIVSAEENSSSQAAVVQVGESLSLVNLNEGFVSIRMATQEPGVDRLLEHFRRVFPPAEHVEKQVVDVRFWRSNNEGCARSSNRSINVPSWGEIQGNYPGSTVDLLSPCSKTSAPATTGS
ncbi:MAG: hypothetical protein WD627_08045 [Actinomycetota bacterium]